MVTDCPFTVAEVVLIIAAELLVGVVPLLLVLVELLLPQDTAINATRSILMPRNVRLKVSIGISSSQIIIMNNFSICTYERRLHPNSQKCKLQSPSPGIEVPTGVGLLGVTALNLRLCPNSPHESGMRNVKRDC